MVILKVLIIFTLSLLIKGGNEIKHMQDTLSFEDVSSDGVQIRCFWLNIEKYAIFDINNLHNQKFYTQEIKKEIDGKVDETQTTLIYYNFCGDAKPPECTNTMGNQVVGKKKSLQDCVEMSGTYTIPNRWALLDDNDATKGIKIVLNQNNTVCGTKCKTVYELRCNPTATLLLPIFDPQSIDILKSENTLIFETKEACPNLDILSMVKFFSENYILFAIIIIILGLFELILGAKILVITIYIISSITIITVIFVFIMQFIVVGNDKPGVFWAVLAIAAVGGLVLGFFIARYKKKVIGFILGGYSGYIVGTLLYSTFLNRIDTTVPWLINIATIIACIIIFVVIAYCFFDHVVIFSTSLIGAYGVIRGIGTLVGNFPNEIVLMKLIGSGEPEQWEIFLTWWVIGYLIGWGIFFIGGVIIQYIIRNKTDDEKKTDGKDNKDKHLISNDKKDYWLN